MHIGLQQQSFPSRSSNHESTNCTKLLSLHAWPQQHSAPGASVAGTLALANGPAISRGEDQRATEEMGEAVIAEIDKIFALQ